MPRLALSCDWGCKVGARQQTGRLRAGHVRGEKRLPAFRSTTMPTVDTPHSLPTSPCSTISSTRTCPATVRTASACGGQRPERRELRCLVSGGARSLLPRRRGLVREDVPHGSSVALSAKARLSRPSAARTRFRLPPCRYRGIIPNDVPCSGLVRGRPPSPLASCRGQRPPAPFLPP